MRLNPWTNLGLMMIEAQQVVFLRALTIAGGGAESAAESRRMVQEKFDAAAEAGLSLMRGDGADQILVAYRRRVRANLRRLSH